MCNLGWLHRGKPQRPYATGVSVGICWKWLISDNSCPVRKDRLGNKGQTNLCEELAHYKTVHGYIVWILLNQQEY